MDKVYLYHPMNEPQPPDQYSDCIASYNTWSTIPDASKKEIYCSGMYYTVEELGQIINKLRHKGVITVTGYDIIEIARHITTGYLLPNEARQLLSHDEQLYACLEIVEFFQQKQLTVQMKRISNYKFVVKAQRP